MSFNKPPYITHSTATTKLKKIYGKDKHSVLRVRITSFYKNKTNERCKIEK